MTPSKIKLLSLIVLVGFGGFFPPNLLAQEYLLFVSESFKGTRCRIYDMDSEANLSIREDRQVGYDSANFSVSPDGRLVLLSSGSCNMISAFFILNDGSLTEPIYFNNENYYSSIEFLSNPLVFHPKLPFFYIGFTPLSIYQYSSASRQIILTNKKLNINNTVQPSPKLGYSSSSGNLILLTNTSSKLFAQSINMNEDGSFGSFNSLLETSNPSHSDLALSPDGKWAVVASRGGPSLCLVKIENNGQLSIKDIKDFETTYPFLSYTPNGQQLLYLGDIYNVLASYDIDQEQGKLTPRHVLYGYPSGWSVDVPGALAITPDGRYAAFRSLKPNDPGRNLIHLVRIHEDGRLEYLPDKMIEVDFQTGVLGFAPLPHNAARDWMMYE